MELWNEHFLDVGGDQGSSSITEQFKQMLTARSAPDGIVCVTELGHPAQTVPVSAPVF